jgi:hypothetical protein
VKPQIRMTSMAFTTACAWLIMMPLDGPVVPEE